jgi:polysaccharide pyruvyl transferase CsaB
MRDVGEGPSEKGGREFDVLMLGYFGMGNLGDELLAKASVDFLSEIGVPSERVAVLSGDPGNTEKRLGVRAFDRWRPMAVYSALRLSRSLLLAGGGLFQDATSIRTPFYYWGVIRAARAAGCAIWAIGQSIGPLKRRVSRILTNRALSSCCYLAVRDAPSLRIAEEFGLSPRVMPDIAMGIALRERPQPEGKRALINARPSRDADEKVLEVMAGVALACANDGFSPIGVAFAREDIRALERVAGFGAPFETILLAERIDDFLDAACGAVLAVGMRLHFAILSLKIGMYTAVCPYDPKVMALADDWRLPVITSEMRGESLSDFGIMTALTNLSFRDTKKEDELHLSVARQFESGLSHALEGGR